MTLREKIGQALWADVERQTESRWPVELDQQLEGLVDADIDFLALAD